MYAEEIMALRNANLTDLCLFYGVDPEELFEEEE